MIQQSSNYRIIIYPTDVAKFYGVNIRTAQRRLEDARFLLGKSKKAAVTIKEFCSVFELNEEEVRKVINDIDSAVMKDQANRDDVG